MKNMVKPFGWIKWISFRSAWGKKVKMLQLLRRIVSAILFALVATAEIAAAWAVLEKTTERVNVILRVARIKSHGWIMDRFRPMGSNGIQVPMRHGFFSDSKACNSEAQILVTAMGLPVGTMLFLRAAMKSKPHAKDEWKEKTGGSSTLTFSSWVGSVWELTSNGNLGNERCITSE